MKHTWKVYSFPVAVLLFAIITALGQTPHGTQSEEVPKGAIDGVNATFTLAFQPAPWGSLHVYRSGLRMQRHVDYELTGPNHTLIVFQPAPLKVPDNPDSETFRIWQGAIIRQFITGIPNPGDSVLADYTY